MIMTGARNSYRPHSSYRPRSWSSEDDRRLLATIYELKVGDKMPCWNDVADRLEGDKTSKSCRLRWENQLKPDINHATFSADEDLVVVNMQRAAGNKWAMIAKMLTTEAEERVWHMRETGELHQNEIYPFRRTDNQVKNRWHAVLKEGKGRKRRTQEAEPDTEPVKRQRLVVKLSSRPVKVVNELPAISELQLSDQAYQPTQHQAVNPATIQEAMPLAGAFPEACKPSYGPGLPQPMEIEPMINYRAHAGQNSPPLLAYEPTACHPEGGNAYGGQAGCGSSFPPQAGGYEGNEDMPNPRDYRGDRVRSNSHNTYPAMHGIMA